MKKLLVAVCLLLFGSVSGTIIAENLSATDTPQGKTTDLNPQDKASGLNPATKVLNLELTDILSEDNKSFKERLPLKGDESEKNKSYFGEVSEWEEKERGLEPEKWGYEYGEPVFRDSRGCPNIAIGGTFFDPEKNLVVDCHH